MGLDFPFRRTERRPFFNVFVSHNAPFKEQLAGSPSRRFSLSPFGKRYVELYVVDFLRQDRVDGTLSTPLAFSIRS